ncbi:hypothetical protein [Nocardia blacklockiae]|uniref:hypothetical protein n=1 Tax=Nocardia blacklockiae TaxID=480036 RepID=UPI0018934427|nr:hypothetical protein [Nocardia blacklockiae]MBF6169848.1 hypothetical protein [Nocardia blacklockiae]
MPPHEVAHDALVDAVRQRYDGVFPAHDPRSATVERALGMAGRLAIDAHPLHLPVAEIVSGRGLADRNRVAWEALHAYAIPAARAALESAGRTGAEVDAVIFETSTVVAMPAPVTAVARALGLRPDCAALPVFGMGCRGGAHAITLAATWLRAHPRATVLIVTADFASPHFHVETELDETGLVGSIVSSALFSDAAAAAVASCTLDEGIEIVDVARYEVPGTPDAITWAATDEGLRFRLTTDAVRSIPAVAPALRGLLDRQGWRAGDLGSCALHSGGNTIIRDAADALGLTARQVAPAWLSLRRGNLMSSAVLDALALIAARPELRPAWGTPLLGAGFGPGFGMDAFAGRALLPAAHTAEELAGVVAG